MDRVDNLLNEFDVDIANLTVSLERIKKNQESFWSYAIAVVHTEAKNKGSVA